SVRGLLIAASLAACTGRPAAPFELRIAVSGALEPVRPEFARSWSTLAQPWVFEPLARLGPDGVMVRILATRLETVNAKSIRVWLRTDARFSDGSPVTLDDVAAAFAKRKLRISAERDSIVISSDEVSIPIE